MAKKVDIEKHVLIPKHVKLNDKEKQELLDHYQITFQELPKIFKNDSAIRHLSPKTGDVIKIIRNDEVSGENIYFRGVINE